MDPRTSRAVSEWPEGLDVPALLESGWRPLAFQQFVLKIHGRCNLACDYCYMYEMADQSWRSKPKAMSRRVLDLTSKRIAEHARGHGLAELDVVLHGGEPLLAGPEMIDYAAQALREVHATEARLELSVQTNGVLLTTEFLELFDRHRIRVGVSLDGDAVGHDRHRRFAHGAGSHAAVDEGLRHLTGTRYRHLFAGLLCTIDLRNDPIATYEALLRYGPPAVDFLLPHANWDTLPPGRRSAENPTPYADWLIQVFDRWHAAGGRETRVRLFNEIIRLLVGGASRTEAVGLSPTVLLVIETDGSIEQVDTLKSAFEGAAATRLHVVRDDFDTALLLPSMIARQIGERALSPICRGCAIRRVCGGGQYPHRYRSGSGFLNPSVYCPDLTKLITHIGTVVHSNIMELRHQVRDRLPSRKDLKTCSPTNISWP